LVTLGHYALIPEFLESDEKSCPRTDHETDAFHPSTPLPLSYPRFGCDHFELQQYRVEIFGRIG